MAAHILAARQYDGSSGYDGGSSGGYGYDAGSSTDDQWLNLLSNPFQSQVQQTSFFASLAWSFGLGSVLALGFCFLRPRTSNVYAPRAKHADDKHRPPRIGKGLFSWVYPIRSVKEAELIQKIGLDATIFLRFLRMIRNIFLILSIVGVGILLPVNLVEGGGSSYGSYSDVYALMKFTPQYIFGQRFWAYVVVAYLINVVIFYFLWSNYRAVVKMRRTYFQSEEYQNSLHSRTLLLTDIPQSSRTDEGIVRIVQEARQTPENPRTAIARNVRDLPELLEEHEKIVRDFEKVLAQYLKNPDRLPATRPKCKPSKKDKAYQSGQEVDAIDYYTFRIQELERHITEVRESVDKRNPLPYGFASYTHIEDAHCVAYAARRKGPHGTEIKLAPRPNDLIWKNLSMNKHVRRTKIGWGAFWMVILTILYIIPNILVAVFLSDLSHLGLVWDAFQTSLEAHPTGYAIAQGIVAPLVQTIFYFFLPAIFRRINQNAGDKTKTSRERHVTNKLYIFFVFNNLIVFSVFAAAWRFVAGIVKADNEGVWDAIQNGHLATKVVIGLCNVSPYWITWQAQRNLSAAVDIIQAWPLIKISFQRRFTNPTPREMIEFSAPQKFEYADYYNNFLFVSTSALAFATIQPLILPIAAFYMLIDAWLKKYLLQYVFITKVESGGVFWKIVFNRMLFAVLLSDAVIALIVGAKGYDTTMLYAMIPLLFILAGFKWYCARTFDDQISYYTTKSTDLEGTASKPARRRHDRVGVRYGNPALYRKLITPMVNAKAQHILKEMYRGRLESNTDGGNRESVLGFSADVYMSQMDPDKPGRGNADLPFELVAESECDFENFKRRADFRHDFGGEGELYGRSEDQMTDSRPGTPSTMMSMNTIALAKEQARRDSRTRSESPAGSSRDGSRTRYGARSESPSAMMAMGEGTSYPRGYHQPSTPPRIEQQAGEIPSGRMGPADITTTGTPYIDETRPSRDQYFDEMDAERPYSGSNSGLIGRTGGMARGESPVRGPQGYSSVARNESPLRRPAPEVVDFERRNESPMRYSQGYTSVTRTESPARAPAGQTIPRRAIGSPTGGGSRPTSQQYYVSDGRFGSGPGTPDENTGYDYFRRGRGM